MKKGVNHMKQNAKEARREYQCAWKNANQDKIRPLKNDFLRKMTKFLREKNIPMLVLAQDFRR